MLAEADVVLLKVAAALESLGITYLVGGSVASSQYGHPRLTADIDFAARLTADSDIGALVVLLEGEFYIDADTIHDAITHHSSFNILDLATMIKADIFVPEETAWRQEQWRRRQARLIGEGDAAREVYFSSPEDTVLQKLLWYRLTGERSDRQWGDVQGVLKVQAGGLDFEYMAQWAEDIGVTDLLEAARAEARI